MHDALTVYGIYLGTVALLAVGLTLRLALPRWAKISSLSTLAAAPAVALGVVAWLVPIR